MQKLWSVPGGPAVATHQLLCNLARRGIGRDLLPWLRERRIPITAYSPIERAKLTLNPKLVDFARHHGMTPAHAELDQLFPPPTDLRTSEMR